MKKANSWKFNIVSKQHRLFSFVFSVLLTASAVHMVQCAPVCTDGVVEETKACDDRSCLDQDACDENAGECFSSSEYETRIATVAPRDGILVLVNRRLRFSMAASLFRFRKNLIRENYAVKIRFVDGETSPDAIRSILRQYYYLERADWNMKGAILIGDIKAAYAYIKTGMIYWDNFFEDWHLRLNAVDAYYMDLDGAYDENIPYYDPCELFACDVFPDNCHCTDERTWFYKDEFIVGIEKSPEPVKENYKIEIWVSRIMGHNFSMKKSENTILREYFSWNNIYRSNPGLVPSRALMLEGITEENPLPPQEIDLTGVFSDITMDYVGRTEYEAYLQEPSGSELFYLGAHSGHDIHVFFDGTRITVDEVMGIKRNSVFYVMNACSSCRWDYGKEDPQAPDYLCGAYVFAKQRRGEDFGLGAIGFTGVGGFNNLKFFSDYLQTYPDSSYGSAFVDWYNRNLTINFGLHNYVFLGDATIGPDTSLQKRRQ